MRVGPKGKHAVIAVLDVAQHADGKAVPLSDVARRSQISLSYLEQLFASLRRDGIVRSARGPGGGYRLSRAPEEISIGSIIRSVEEDRTNMAEPGPRAEAAVTSSLWSSLDGLVESFLTKISIADVLEGRVRQPERQREPEHHV
jgi:Rrf2 family transcriptional regulator, iron-sulfur cluster assembly transcription factor